MEKVKITPEQEKALLSFKDKRSSFEESMSVFIQGREHFFHQYKSLKDLSVKEFSLLLHDHYEVEKPCPIAEYLMKRRGEIRFEFGDQIVLSGDRHQAQPVGHLEEISAERAKTLYENGRIVFFYPAETKISKWEGR